MLPIAIGFGTSVIGIKLVLTMSDANLCIQRKQRLELIFKSVNSFSNHASTFNNTYDSDIHKLTKDYTGPTEIDATKLSKNVKDKIEESLKNMKSVYEDLFEILDKEYSSGFFEPDFLTMIKDYFDMNSLYVKMLYNGYHFPALGLKIQQSANTMIKYLRNKNYDKNGQHVICFIQNWNALDSL